MKKNSALHRYRTMRDFEATSEPRGEVGPERGKGLIFVVQRHDATRLHFDFRLEWGGVLKSWAVPKGPSMVPGDKRLAVQVEDHPLEYASFEGAIPEGHYGAGHVLRWDQGSWEPEGDVDRDLGRGRLTFTLHGKRLRGRFSLVRMRTRAGEKDQWLLLKSSDEYAARRGAPPVTEVAPAPPPGAIHVQLATLVDELPEGEEWIFEPKFDGYRAVATVAQGAARIVSRTGKDWTERFAVIRGALAELPVTSAVLDGEVCALDEHGISSFQKLQNALGSPRGRRDLVYFVFDLLFVDGFDVRDRPLETRKAMLASILSGQKAPLSYVSHVDAAHGAKLFELACRRGAEGVVAKRKDLPYRDARTREWVKVKCQKRQEMVIVGFTPPKGSRTALGSLLLAVNEKGGLRYAGKVGTGLTEQSLTSLGKRLSRLTVDSPPVAGAPRMRQATWVKPELVAEIAFTEWTADGRLRHPSFLGLREDKPPSEVVRERAAPAKTEVTAVRGVRITHPARVIDSRSGLTKLQLVRYYDSVAEYILPYISRRPLALVRCPEGDRAECFFQKQRTPGMPSSIHGGKVDGRAILYVEDAAGLIALAQFGAVELHGWGSRMPDVHRPDWLVIDLDPDEGVPFSRTVEAARAVRELLSASGLESFAKTTGGKGLHVVAPVAPELSFDEMKEFTLAVASHFARREPERYTATLSKRARHGKIFVDYLRNGHGATAVVPYSARARPGATVAWPVSWRDLGHVDPKEFTVDTVPGLLARRRKDPWAELLGLEQRVPREAVRGLRKSA